MSISTAMVFAAGRGTRMRHLTADTPKVMIEVAGKPLLDHALDQVRDAGLPRAVVNTHYCADKIERHLKNIADPEISLSQETETLLETGGGIRHAQNLLGHGPIVTLNADAVWTKANPLTACLKAWDQNMEALLLLAPRENTTGHNGKGDFFLDDQMRPIRRGDASTAPYVFLGVQILNPARAYAHPEKIFSLNTIWDQMISQGSLYATLFDGGWCDVGQQESIPLAEGLLA